MKGSINRYTKKSRGVLYLHQLLSLSSLIILLVTVMNVSRNISFQYIDFFFMSYLGLDHNGNKETLKNSFGAFINEMLGDAERSVTGQNLPIKMSDLVQTVFSNFIIVNFVLNTYL